jgi:hypothetical protein
MNYCYQCKSVIPLNISMHMANNKSFCTMYCRTQYFKKTRYKKQHDEDVSIESI